MAKRKTKFTDAIRAAVEESGMSRYAIGKATGIDAAQLCRLMQGGGLGFDALDRLAELLDLRVVCGKPHTSKRKAGDA